MRLYHLLVIIFFFIATNLIASNVVIKGNAATFKGKEISIYNYADFISNQKIQIGFTTVKQNGSYNFEFNAEEIKKIFVKIEDKSAWFFVKPGEVYNINLNYDERFNKGRIYDKQLSVIFNFPVPIEINQQVRRFNQKFDQFIEDNKVLFEKRDRSIEPKLKSFKLKMLKEAENSNSEFVRNYIKYSIASTQNALDVSYKIKDAKKGSNTKANIYLEYLNNKPILYHNPEYINFFKDFFDGELKTLSLKVQGFDISKAINDKSSYSELSKALGKYPFLENDEFKNLFMLNGLFEISKDKYFTKKNITAILLKIKTNSKYPEHKIIASNIIDEINKKKFGKGSIAPDFSLKNKDNDIISLNSFKGKPIYINFWTTWSIPSQKEMKIMQKLYKEYKNKIEFISICADNDFNKMTSFISKNEDYKWTFLHLGNNNHVLEKYKVSTFPQYILINKDLKILKAPAGRPGGTAERASEDNIEKDFYNLTNNH
jgi:thiol-disulfide isomerase/thioredoxin